VEDGFTTDAAHTACSRCLADYYRAGDDCTPCPDTVACPRFSTSANWALDAGYWRSAATSTDVRECKLGKVACAGGNETSQYCRRGYSGPLCDVCARRFFYHWGQGNCQPCGEARSHLLNMTVWLVLAVVLVVCVLMAQVCDNVRTRQLSAGHPTRRMLRISREIAEALHVLSAKGQHVYHNGGVKFFLVVVTLQVIYAFSCVTFATGDVRYPNPARAFANVAGVANFEVLAYVPIECIFPNGNVTLNSLGCGGNTLFANI